MKSLAARQGHQSWRVATNIHECRADVRGLDLSYLCDTVESSFGPDSDKISAVCRPSHIGCDKLK